MKTLESLKNYSCKISLDDLTHNIKSNVNFNFTKFGDGEYLCMKNKLFGKNCDGDKYHRWLGKSLKRSFINLCKKESSYIGKWHTSEVSDYLSSLVLNEPDVKNINWVDYHFVMNASPIENTSDFNSFNNTKLLDFVKTIQATKRKKIIFSNIDNIKLKELFNADIFIETTKNNWSFDYQKYFNTVEKEITENCILITAAGLCSKVLISDIQEKHKVTCIDIGSGFDLIATGRHSRPWKHSYEDELNYYKSILPKNWKN